MELEALEGTQMVLLGLGVENEALGRFLLAAGLRFSVCDARGPEAFEALREEWGQGVRRWHLGADYLDSLEEFELIWRTPGISPRRPELRRARARGTRISSQMRLFMARCPAPVVGVTGTKGKGTTSALLAAILRAGPGARVWLGGNIGVPPISFLDQVHPADRVVLELSSFQLQDLERSPQIAVVLNIGEDHLDYHRDRREYLEAKRAICRYQGRGDVLIVDRDCGQSRAFARESPAQQWAFSAAGEVEVGAWIAGGRLQMRRPGGGVEAICAVAEIPLRGRHNQRNAAAAAAAGAAAGANRAQIVRGIRGFEELEHRLESLGEHRGVSWYNDSLATTPAATIAALEAFEAPVVLIAGGSSKGADFAALGRTIAAGAVRALVLLGEEGARIARAAERAGFAGEVVWGSRSMAEAVAAAGERARPGDVLLLSPACASFGLFSGYKERGEEFTRCARAWPGRSDCIA